MGTSCCSSFVGSQCFERHAPGLERINPTPFQELAAVASGAHAQFRMVLRLLGDDIWRNTASGIVKGQHSAM